MSLCFDTDAYLRSKTDFLKGKFDLKWKTSHKGLFFELYFAIRKRRLVIRAKDRWARLSDLILKKLEWKLGRVERLLFPWKLRFGNLLPVHLLELSPLVLATHHDLHPLSVHKCTYLRNMIYRVARFARNYTALNVYQTHRGRLFIEQKNGS